MEQVAKLLFFRIIILERTFIQPGSAELDNKDKY